MIYTLNALMFRGLMAKDQTIWSPAGTPSNTPRLPKTRPQNRSLAIFHSVFVQMVFVTAPPQRRGQKFDRYADFLARNGRFRAPLNNMNNSSIFEQ